MQNIFIRSLVMNFKITTFQTLFFHLKCLLNILVDFQNYIVFKNL